MNKYQCHRLDKVFPFVLLVLAVFSLSSIVFIDVSLNRNIEITGVFYNVNDQGDLMIQLTGEINGVSAAKCDYKIQFPDNFEVETLPNGSPVIELLLNGSARDINEDGSVFNVLFALRTYNTTLLPKIFLLKIESALMKYTGFITPQWSSEQNNQIDNSGFAGYPYITGFYAYDSEKGQTEHVKTYIYNPSDLPKYLNYLQYKIKSYDYWEATTNNYWHDQTKQYNENKYIPDRYTLVVHDYLSCIFTSFSGNKRYALNKGDYDVTEVYASGSGWNDYDYPNYAFNIKDPSSGMKVVFVAHLVDDDFRNEFDETSFFNDLEGDDYDFTLGQEPLMISTTLDEYFNIDFISGVYDWDIETTDI